MFGTLIEGPPSVFGDNGAVVKNASLPESVLSKKHNSIAYHRVREAVASGTLIVVYVKSGKNLADMPTKPLVLIRLHAICKEIL